jgi:hypothetical protein
MATRPLFRVEVDHLSAFDVVEVRLELLPECCEVQRLVVPRPRVEEVRMTVPEPFSTPVASIVRALSSPIARSHQNAPDDTEVIACRSTPVALIMWRGNVACRGCAAFLADHLRAVALEPVTPKRCGSSSSMRDAGWVCTRMSTSAR